MSITKAFDERFEIAAWLVIILAAAGLYTGHLKSLHGAILIALGLLSLVGIHRFEGAKLGPFRIKETDDCDEEKP